MKRGPNQKLAEAIGIRMTRRVPGQWGRSVLVTPGTAYTFEFPALVLRINKHSRRCRPGARWYASSLGVDAGQTDEDAWRLAIEQFREAIRPLPGATP